MQRNGWKALAALVIGGCTVDFWVPSEPPTEDVMVGGLGDTRPYFGTLRTIKDPEAGEFMLATCGCGDWRVLMETADGRERWQFPVHFYLGGDVPEETIKVFGREDDDAAIASLRDSLGELSGRAELGGRLYTFTAGRGDNHVDNASACVRCHIGDDPIWPQPPGHPSFQLNPANCLSCHNVVINE